MKIICFDFGDARVGVAVSDPGRKMAFAGKTINVTGLDDAAEKAAAAVAENGCDTVVVGLPINMNGTQTHRAERTRVFCAKLREKCGIEPELCDERLSSVEAYTYMNITEYNGRKRRKVIDSLSAQIILQSYIDRKKNT